MEYYTIPDAVKRWPLLTYSVLRSACVASSRGKGPTIGRKIGNKWIVTAPEVERFIHQGTPANTHDQSDKKDNQYVGR